MGGGNKSGRRGFWRVGEGVSGIVNPRCFSYRGMSTASLCQRKATPAVFLALCGFGQQCSVSGYRKLEQSRCGMAGWVGEAEGLCAFTTELRAMTDGPRTQSNNYISPDTVK